MDTRIGSTQGPTPVPARRTRDREPEPERRFVLPHGEDDEEEGAEHGVLEPQPRRGAGEKPVSRALLEDEAGHRIDVRG